ncbi:MAG: DUF5916 domain-containing protein [Saprospiraceae bacterium]
MKIEVIIVIVMLISPPIRGEKQVIIPFDDGNILIDGQLDENIWSDKTSLTNFNNHFPIDQGLSKNQTEVKIFHNGTYLYIGAVYHDSESRNNVSTLKRDNYNDGVFLSDCLGIVLDPYNKGDNGYLFVVNAENVQYDALIGGTNVLSHNWNTIWTSKTKTRGNDKFYEIAIPLDAINFNANNSIWGLQIFINDTKINLFSTLEFSSRNFTQYNLRHTRKIEIQNLPDKVSNKYTLLPAITASRTKIISSNIVNDHYQISLDGQYNITPSIRIDVALNPDFSQVEVDQQVTNLTRFAINIPERRKFFLENSDLFNSLGSSNINPFYSRRIGITSDILFGAKVSGNISDKIRMGILYSRTKGNDEIKGTDYAVGVVKYNISSTINSTIYTVNTLANTPYNSVAGVKMNYHSPNNKWASSVNYGKAYAQDKSGNNDFISAEVAYNTPTFEWNARYQKIGTNYIAETGFIPQQFIYDPASDQVIREGFTIADGGFQVKHYPKKSKHIDWIRRFWVQNVATFNQDNSLRSNTIFWSPFAIRFKNRSYIYAAALTVIDNLDYGFDFLQNGKSISSGRYVQSYGRIGYWSPTNNKVYISTKLEYGQFFGGTRFNPEIKVTYRMLPKAVFSAAYSINDIALNELGNRAFHLAKLTSEIYFNNTLNWTTYLQYNTQANNFNINSRVQWEYKPLSYIYLVFTNNYNNDFLAKNWGFSFKINRRLDF